VFPNILDDASCTGNMVNFFVDFRHGGNFDENCIYNEIVCQNIGVTQSIGVTSKLLNLLERWNTLYSIRYGTKLMES